MLAALALVTAAVLLLTVTGLGPSPFALPEATAPGVLPGLTTAPVPQPLPDGGIVAAGSFETEVVATLTGPDSINATEERWNVGATDLGHSFEHKGELYMVFGDTYGPGGRDSGDDWRSNVMARIEDADPTNGLEFVAMVGGDNGRAGELLGSHKINLIEKTVIPTYGISVEGRMYLHYMSVRRWTGPGTWVVGYSGLAYSDDDGHTWTKDPDARWSGAGNFAQVAMVEQDGFVYLYGIPAGRFGSVRLARVASDRMLDLAAYSYWDGTDWIAGDPSAALDIVSAPVGELSVRWSEYHRRWLMMYLDEDRAAIVLRTSAAIDGPWSDARTVLTAESQPQLYAPYLLPSVGEGPDLYFTMSVWEPYNVLLMRARGHVADDTLIASG